MFQVDRGSILLLDEETNELTFVSLIGESDQGLKWVKIPANQGVVGQVVQNRQPYLINDAQTHPHFYSQVDQLTGQHTRSILCAPLIVRDHVIGAIQLINKKEGGFTNLDLALVITASSIVAGAVGNARLYEAQTTLLHELRTSQEQLLQSEKLAATGRLAASLAHEINNPLQAIHSCLQLSLNFTLTPEKQTLYMKMADEEVKRLVELVTRVLEFARPSLSTFKSTSINKLVREVLRLADKHLIHRNLIINQTLASDLPFISVVPDQISQVFLHILLNVVDAVPVNAGILDLKTRVHDNHIDIIFQDNGEGIAPENLEKIFEPFFTTRHDRVGLGLSTSYTIMERHQGTISIESTPNHGTTVTVSLPITTHDHW
jgi:signal transduction histidine kinase